MNAVAIDHINIRTDRLDESCSFYERLLKLERGAAPGLDPAAFAWLRNNEGQAVIHVASPAEQDGRDAIHTGALHHVAFTCADYAEWRARIEAMDVGFEANDLPAAGIRQLFVRDPNGILLEFNFMDQPAA